MKIRYFLLVAAALSLSVCTALVGNGDRLPSSEQFGDRAHRDSQTANNSQVENTTANTSTTANANTLKAWTKSEGFLPSDPKDDRPNSTVGLAAS